MLSALCFEESYITITYFVLVIVGTTNNLQQYSRFGSGESATVDEHETCWVDKTAYVEFQSDL